MKTRKSYRLSPRSVEALEKLKVSYPTWTETDLIEAAIESLIVTDQMDAAEKPDPKKTLAIDLYSNAYDALLAGNAEAEAAWRKAAVAVEEAIEYDQQGL